MTKNMEEYREELEKRMDEAVSEFEGAKANAIKAIEGMTWNSAESIGAVCISGIENATIAASKGRAIGSAISAFDYLAAQDKAPAR